MPKIVDHQQRREQLAEAVFRLVVREGLASASVRNVAAEAGWSSGSVRYYFPRHDELKAFAAEVASRRIAHDVVNRLPTDPSQCAPVEFAARCMESLLPLDQKRRAEYKLWVDLVQRESGLPAEERSLLWAGQRSLCRDVIAHLIGTGSARLASHSMPERIHVPLPSPDAEQLAHHLHIFIDGLASQMMFLPHEVNAELARTTLRDFLALLRGETSSQN
ncbi:TetR/AcrR family transcriptional regulator [Natronoglycomyces albus]|uniref:TetR family transcriptional regulator C-terminal domain-containing protein n=1 Tax=Natronoglycomyces albus TaxID=2811108 RepID=A0A895XKN4_9ACTN|nr:TetR family transcriptional regulator C-terminal domain-containing protein [Natronoglycomyces albus]QSB06291.1 TetR family transcriptional regulator C-terminal domain-containing protein [Natronoglycomyces albus]